jgi:transposase
LQYNFNWDKMSAVAGLTFHNFYFRLYKGSIKSAEVVEFLGALLRHIPGRLTIVWDGLSAHNSNITRGFIEQNHQRLCVEYLPGYAPELNPSRVHLGLLEAAHPAQCLPEGLLVAQ